LTNCPREQQNLKFTEITPAIHASQPQWVQCHGYRCLALLGQDGKWRCFATGEELKDVVKAPID
jgi:hypothetical protein